MNEIKFLSFLNIPEEKLKKLKLAFNSDWNYKPQDVPPYAQTKLGDSERYFRLLFMYGHGDADIVRESVKTHNPLKKRFHNGEFVLSFVPYDKDSNWLLVNAYKVIDDSKYLVDADESAFSEMVPYLGRLVVHWKRNGTMNILMKDKKAMDERLTVKCILDTPYYKIAEKFPGYENVNLSWRELRYAMKLNTWKTALENQKGVYLITDTKTNKRYVGSAYGDDMMLGRWMDYVENGHGGNKALRKLIDEQGFDYVKENFRYSILDIFKSTVDDKTIINRESWWKEILLTVNSDFGYNCN